MTVVHDMPAADYHARPELGSSALREILRSPFHYWSAYEAPQGQRIVREETPAMRLGTLAHACILEPARWGAEYVVAPDVDKRFKEGKATYAAFLEASKGRTVIDFDDAAKVEGMRDAVRRHKAAAFLTRDVEGAEVSLFWECETTGIECKARLDVTTRGIVVDLKTTEDASRAEFERSIANYSYHVQAAHYLEGYKTAFGREPAGYVWIVVEKKPPHAVAVYAIDAAALERGHVARLRALDTLAECRASGEWPGYGDTIGTAGLPAWAA